MSSMGPASFVNKRAATSLESLGCLVMLLRSSSSCKGEVVGKRRRARVPSGWASVGVRIVKSPWIPLHPSLEPLNYGSCGKVFVWSVHFAGVMWILFLVFGHDVCTVKFPSWKLLSCWLNLLCFREDTQVCLSWSPEKFQCYEKKN